MQRLLIRWLLFAGLAAFVPLFYFMAVIGGWLPYGAILLIGIRNISDSSFWLLIFIHLATYGVVLYWVSGSMARLLMIFARSNVMFATALVLFLLAGIGLLPIFGAAHGEIHWVNAYELYASDSLR